MFVLPFGTVIRLYAVLCITLVFYGNGWRAFHAAARGQPSWYFPRAILTMGDAPKNFHPRTAQQLHMLHQCSASVGTYYHWPQACSHVRVGVSGLRHYRDPARK